MPDVIAPAEPSAAAVQYDSWDDKGTPIVSKKSEPSTQDSAPAVQGKPEAKPDAAEPGAAKDKQESKPKKDKLTADERIAQLEATIEKIRQGKGEQQPTKAAEPSAAKPVNPADQIKAEIAALKKPDIKDFTGDDAYERYEAAKDDFNDKRSELKAKLAKAEAKAEALDEFRQEQARTEADRKFNEELAKVKERRPDLEQVAAPAAQKIWNDPDVHGGVKQAFAKNPLTMDIMYVLGGDEQKLSDFIALSKSDPIAAIQHIGELTHLIREELNASSKTEKVERGADGKFQSKAEDKKETPAQPQPRAPKPPSEVGGRGTAPDDPAVAAARNGDFKAAEAEWNRRAFAPRN